MGDAGVAFDIVSKSLTDKVNRYLPEEDGFISKILRELDQLAFGVVSAGLAAMVVIGVREYLAANERELVRMKACVKRQRKALFELDEFRKDLSNALTTRNRAHLPPPPNASSYQHSEDHY